MQKSVSSTFKSTDLDPLAEADDVDALGVFLKSWEVPDKEILRKILLVSRTFSDVQRDDFSEVLVGDVELVPGELLPEDDLDEALAIKKKVEKEKQQTWNRDRSELLGTDHKQTRGALRAELEPG